MLQFRSKTPVCQRTIQPIIHQEIQPIITKNIQPVINQKIQPVVHKEIQPVIIQEIQPIITREIQPVINRKIQPVIFNEDDTNIEEVIRQLNEYPNGIKEEHSTITKLVPSTQNEVRNIEKLVIQPYIERVVKSITKRIEDKKTERMVKNIEKIEYIPYIQKKNGEIVPYDANEKNPIPTVSKLMETVIAVNFISLSDNITYPMACKKTDIFSKIEKKLYQEFPELKKKNIYFISNGNTVNRDWTFEQNKIKTGNTILITEIIN